MIREQGSTRLTTRVAYLVVQITGHSASVAAMKHMLHDCPASQSARGDAGGEAGGGPPGGERKEPQIVQPA